MPGKMPELKPLSTGTSLDRLDPVQILFGTPKFGDSGTEWDSVSDELLKKMAETDAQMAEGREHAEREGRTPYSGSRQYEGAQEAWRQRQEWLEELGLRRFAERLDIALTEYPRWRVMLIRESGPVAPQSHLTAETAMRSAVAVDRLITLKLTGCGVPKAIAEAFHVECYSYQETEMRQGVERNIRSNFEPIIYADIAKLQQAFEGINADDKDKTLEILSQAFNMLAGDDYKFDVGRFIRSSLTGVKEEGIGICTDSLGRYYRPENVIFNEASKTVGLVPFKSFGGSGAAGHCPQTWMDFINAVERFSHRFGNTLAEESLVDFKAINAEARARALARKIVPEQERDIIVIPSPQMAR